MSLIATALPFLALLHAVALHVCRLCSHEVSGVHAALVALAHIAGTSGLVAWSVLDMTALPGLRGAMAVGVVAVSYRSLVRGRSPARVPMDERVVVVTGANAGIGKDTAKQLMAMGATVVFACRSQARAQSAMDECLRDTAQPLTKAVFVALDLSDSASVRSFVKKLEDQGRKPDVLVCNAGMMQEDNITTKEGRNLTLAANHYGHFLLTRLLLDAHGPFRIVVVSSALHYLTQSADEFRRVFEGTEPYSMFGYYGASKLANILVTRWLARRFGAEAVAVTLHPGNVLTDVSRQMPAWMQWGKTLSYPLLYLILKQPAMGAYTSVHAATAPLGPEDSGAYLVHCKPAPTSTLSQDEALQDWLWRHSEDVLGLERMA